MDPLALHFAGYTATSQHELEMAIFEQLECSTFNNMSNCSLHKKLKS